MASESRARGMAGMTAVRCDTVVVLLLLVAPLGWPLLGCPRYLAYRLHVTELLAEAGLDPANYSPAETQGLENTERRCYFKRRSHQDAAAAVVAAASRRCPTDGGSAAGAYTAPTRLK